MKFIIIILLFNLVLAQDIGQKMFDNGDSDSAILFYKRLLNNEDISNDDLIYNLASSMLLKCSLYTFTPLPLFNLQGLMNKHFVKDE